MCSIAVYEGPTEQRAGLAVLSAMNPSRWHLVVDWTGSEHDNPDKKLADGKTGTELRSGFRKSLLTGSDNRSVIEVAHFGSLRYAYFTDFGLRGNTNSEGNDRYE